MHEHWHGLSSTFFLFYYLDLLCRSQPWKTLNASAQSTTLMTTLMIQHIFEEYALLSCSRESESKDCCLQSWWGSVSSMHYNENTLCSRTFIQIYSIPYIFFFLRAFAASLKLLYGKTSDEMKIISTGKLGHGSLHWQEIQLREQ